MRHHGGISGPGPWVGQVTLVPQVVFLVPLPGKGVQVLGRSLQGGMGDGRGVVQEEGLVLVLAHKRDRIREHHIVCIGCAVVALPVFVFRVEGLFQLLVGVNPLVAL